MENISKHYYFKVIIFKIIYVNLQIFFVFAVNFVSVRNSKLNYCWIYT